MLAAIVVDFQQVTKCLAQKTKNLPLKGRFGQSVSVAARLSKCCKHLRPYGFASLSLDRFALIADIQFYNHLLL